MSTPTFKSIAEMTPDERLTAAAVIMRDGIEKRLAERAAQQQDRSRLAVAS